MLQQRLNQVAATVNLDLRTIFILQLLDLAGDIATDWDRRFPVEIDRPM